MKLSFPHSKNFFPLELVNEVLNYCQPNELFAVTLTNSDYRIEAERILYKSIILHNWILDPRTACCLSTLAKIQSKADMVESFELIYIDGWRVPRIELQWLCGSLVGMRSLKHLKLNFWRDESNEYRDIIPPLLIPLLKSCTFSLATLYVPSMLLDDWILSQNQLQILGILELDVKPRLLLQDRLFPICKQLSIQNSSLTTVFTIAAPYDLKIDRMMAFPVFSVNARWSAKDVADSIPWKNAHSITYFKLLLDSLSEAGTVHDVLTSLAEHFLDLESISLIVRDPRIHLSPSSFSCLDKFPYLMSLEIEYYNYLYEPMHAPFHANYLDLASSWATDCPKLCRILFPDGRIARCVESGHWVESGYWGESGYWV